MFLGSSLALCESHSQPQHVFPSAPPLERFLSADGRFDWDAALESGYEGPIDISGFKISVDSLTGEPIFALSEVSQGEIADDDVNWLCCFTIPGPESRVKAMAIYNGELIVAGGFQRVGCVIASKVAAWDGTRWKRLGGGIDGFVYALAVYDGKLILGGTFTKAGGLTVNRIVAWDGYSYVPLGSGIRGEVRALTVYEGELIAGGTIWQAGEKRVRNIAAWDGADWHALGSGVDATVVTLTVHDGKLVAGGHPIEEGGFAPLRAWDGESWTLLGNFDDHITCAASYGDFLIVGGLFTGVDSIAAAHLARWDGSEWSEFEGGTEGGVYCLTSYGDTLLVGGMMEKVGGIGIDGMAVWDGSQWSSLGPVGQVFAFARSEDGYFIGGRFSEVGGMRATNVVLWDGIGWQALGRYSYLELREVAHLGTYDGKLYACGGQYENWWCGPILYQWDGVRWMPIDYFSAESSDPHFPIYPFIEDMVAYDGRLVVGGLFDWIDTESGWIRVHHIASWDGTRWDNLGGGIDPDGFVISLGVWDGKLVVGGGFTSAGGKQVNNIATWDGIEWKPLGDPGGWVHDIVVYKNSLVGCAWRSVLKWNGKSWAKLGAFDGRVSHLAVYNGNLIASGSFTRVDRTSVNHIASYDGVRWSDLGGGLSAPPRDILVYNGTLVAIGDFVRAGGNVVHNIARWNGQSWEPLGSGLGGVYAPNALATLDGTLYAGGYFIRAGDKAVYRIACWRDPYVALQRFEAELADGSIELSWTNPTDDDFRGVIIRFSNDGFPQTPDEGQGVPNGADGFFEGDPGDEGFFSHTGVIEGKRYYYSAFAVNFEGEYSQALLASVAIPDTLPPQPPLSFTVVTSQKDVELYWTTSTSGDAGGTVIRFSHEGFPETPADGEPVPNGNDGRFEGDPGSSGFFAHTDLTPFTTYYYSAFAFDLAGNYSAPKTAIARPVDTVPPDRLPNFKVSVRCTTITLKWWNPLGDYKGTFIGYSTDGFPSLSTAIPLPNGNEGRFEGPPGSHFVFVHAPEQSGSYYYCAWAYDACDNYSAPVCKLVKLRKTSDTVPPSSTPRFRAVPVAGRIEVRWTAPDEDCERVLIRFSDKTFPTDPTSGQPLPNGNDGYFAVRPGKDYKFVHTGCDTCAIYYYSAWAIDDCDNFSDPAYTSAVCACPAASKRHVEIVAITPTPSSRETVITARLNFIGMVDMTVYDVLGRRVATRRYWNGTGGVVEFSWDTKDDSGRELPSGVYFIEIASGGKKSIHKTLIVR